MSLPYLEVNKIKSLLAIFSKSIKYIINLVSFTWLSFNSWVFSRQITLYYKTHWVFLSFFLIMDLPKS